MEKIDDSFWAASHIIFFKITDAMNMCLQHVPLTLVQLSWSCDRLLLLVEAHSGEVHLPLHVGFHSVESSSLHRCAVMVRKSTGVLQEGNLLVEPLRM